MRVTAMQLTDKDGAASARKWLVAWVLMSSDETLPLHERGDALTNAQDIAKSLSEYERCKARAKEDRKTKKGS